jgi:CubicO group peptidase (beta-lactamase class C family)
LNIICNLSFIIYAFESLRLEILQKIREVQMRFLSGLVIVVILVILPLSAQEITDQINQVMSEFIKLDLFSGTVLVAKDGKIIYASAFGEADKDFHVKNTLDTRFNIGSIGKTFTGTSIMQLAQRGQLNVMDPVIKYLPDFPFGEKILIHHLLTHTSGTFNYFAHPDFAEKMYSIRSVNDALPLIYDQKLQFQTPGEKFSYSNSGIVILGAIIEKVSGISYPEYIQKNILDPTEMKDTGIHYLEDVVENRAVGYDKMITGKFKRNLFSVPPANADGGIETTVLDMLKFDQALYETSLVNEESKKKMFTPFLEDYGYCWRIRNDFNNVITGHGGGAPGVSAEFRRYTTDRYTLVVLSNYGGGTTPVAETIEAILFGQEFPQPKPLLGEYLFKTFTDKGEDYVKENFQALLKDGDYQIRSPLQLNAIGYNLLFDHYIEMAIIVFENNIKLFPNDANIHDSLGEAYMAIGDYTNSRRMYKKALELDPSFDNAKIMLQKLDALETK